MLRTFNQRLAVTGVLFLMIFGSVSLSVLAKDHSTTPPRPLPQFSAAIEGSPFFRATHTGLGAGGAVVDLDNDGISEIIQPIDVTLGTGISKSEPIVIFGVDGNNNSLSVKTKRYLLSNPPRQNTPRVSVTGDFNGDGFVDYFLGGHGIDEPPYPGEPDYFLLSQKENNVVRFYSEKAEPKTNTYTHGVATGDVNRDGISDIYVGLLSGNTGSYFLMGVTQGSPLADFTRLNNSLKSGEDRFASADLVDVNGDDWLDLILGSHGGAPNVVYLNDGNGRYLSNSPDITMPPGIFGERNTITVDIVHADIDTNGADDLLLSQTKSDPFYSGYGIQLLLNEAGELKDYSDRLQKSSFRNDNEMWRLKIQLADFYGDGITDFVTRLFYNNNGEGFLVWLNDGSGHFEPFDASLFKSNPGPSMNMVYPVDVNGDGLSDIVELQRENGIAFFSSTYLNKGNPTTSKLIQPVVVRQPTEQSVTSGDVVTISASVKGSRPLKFQWLKNGKVLPNANRPVLNLSRVRKQDQANYQLRITNASGSVLTKSVRLIVLPPRIETQNSTLKK